MSTASTTLCSSPASWSPSASVSGFRSRSCADVPYLVRNIATRLAVSLMVGLILGWVFHR
jgi:hypothetical protein